MPNTPDTLITNRQRKGPETGYLGTYPHHRRNRPETRYVGPLAGRGLPDRLGYYKLAFESLLASETPLAVVWPMIFTWTLSASVLPPMQIVPWRTACEALGLAGESFGERLDGLDHFLNTIEELLEKTASSQGL